MTLRGVIYMTKMKQNLKYEVKSYTCYMNENGQMQWKEEFVIFRKEIKSRNEETGEVEKKTVEHHARTITYIDERKRDGAKLVRLRTNDLATEYEEIVAIYRARWAIESLFRQIKQNFPLRYFYGESANAIKIQIWVTLIAYLLITLMQKGVSRSWSFSGLATIVRIMLMYYIDVQGFPEYPEKDWEEALAALTESPPEAEVAEKIALVHMRMRAWKTHYHLNSLNNNWFKPTFHVYGQQYFITSLKYYIES